MYKPVKLAPVYKHYIWGGDKLKKNYGKNGESDNIAESWELSTHKDGQNIIISGDYKGFTLNEYINVFGKDILGIKAGSADEPQIIIKLIDARDNLSIQVHPDNEYARKHENDDGKTELWIVLECEPNSYLYYGVKNEIKKDELENAVHTGKILELLQKVPIKEGDVLFIPAGTIHAICKGVVICEIQQKSNITYRLYDYDRLDTDGNKRPLHIKKALDTSCLKPIPLNKTAENILLKNDDFVLCMLHSCEYFNAYLYNVKKEFAFYSGKESFVAITVVDGSGYLKFDNEIMEFSKGETIFIPAQDKEYLFSGKFKMIAVTL